jgi:phosphoglycolate phosphatase-like HAD superfamily hydrolase
MARNAGAWSIGVPGGFPNAAALERAKPDLFAERLSDAVDALIGGPGSAG